MFQLLLDGCGQTVNMNTALMQSLSVLIDLNISDQCFSVMFSLFPDSHEQFSTKLAALF